MLAIGELDVSGTIVSELEGVRANLRFELIITPKLVEVIRVFHQEVRHRWMMTCMLVVAACPIFKIRLERFT